MSGSTKKWTPVQCVQWTYKRQEGDIEVFARNEKEAFETLAMNGFGHLKDRSKLRRTGKTLQEHLATEPPKSIR